MRSRGQARFARLSPLGALNYSRLMSGPATGSHYEPFARDLAERSPFGSCEIEAVATRLPVWVRLTLRKA